LIEHLEQSAEGLSVLVDILKSASARQAIAASTLATEYLGEGDNLAYRPVGGRA
jgi:hypothetical protein